MQFEQQHKRWLMLLKMCWNKFIIISYFASYRWALHTGWGDTFSVSFKMYIGGESIMKEIDDERKIFLAWMPWKSFSLHLYRYVWFMSPDYAWATFCLSFSPYHHFHHFINYNKCHCIVAKMNTRWMYTYCYATYLSARIKGKSIMHVSVTSKFHSTLKIVQNALIEKHNLVSDEIYTIKSHFVR